jgi:hypothetical protein
MVAEVALRQFLSRAAASFSPAEIARVIAIVTVGGVLLLLAVAVSGF